MEPVIVDEFEDEMIFPTGYEEDYQYREDIIKPNQAVDPRRQGKVQHTNHDRSNGNHFSQQKLILSSNGINPINSDSNYQFDRVESQYGGLVESQL